MGERSDWAYYYDREKAGGNRFEIVRYEQEEIRPCYP